MRLMQHPTFSDIYTEAPDGEVDRWTAQGWVPVLDDDQMEQVGEIEAGTDVVGSNEHDDQLDSHRQRRVGKEATPLRASAMNPKGKNHG